MVREVPIMVAAIVIAIAVMLFAAGPVGAFIDRHPTVKMLAFAFLLLIGVALVADGLHFHIPRGYLYFAVGFSIFVESLNLWSARRRRARVPTRAGPET
jgi:predicted tellurium resistance membrane protein TerC